MLYEGGSDAMPVWKKRIVKTGKKKGAGEVVKMPNRAVKMVERVSRFQRGSWHCAEALEVVLKEKDMGKEESNGTLEMPLRRALP